jgi:ATP-dependent helicase/nuclease subunit A
MEAGPAQSNSLTPSQQRAVAARGNVLVMAGAGTGKTKTLVERCLDCLERERVGLDELLVVTFTEAAAAEMRQRLRTQLEKKAAANPGDEHWQQQLALFDIAHIGTLHSFCLKLVREHFYELGLDPQFAVLDEGEARQRADETLDELFRAHYAGEDEFSLAVQNLIQIHGGGRDENIRKLVLRLHHYSQARPDAAGWLAAQLTGFSADKPATWEQWLLNAVRDWRAEWLPVLEGLQSENVKAGELAKYLSRLPENFTRPSAAEVLADMAAADLTANYPKGKAGKLRPALGSIFDEAKFLGSLLVAKNGRDPLAEDWSWVRGQMATLLRLTQEFSDAFSRQKIADGVVDFHDLEQLALKLLWDFAGKKPTTAANGWRERLRFVFVDEYQDINAAQDKIIQALSRENGNRFLVGDVKQSIYRFRLADPKIFRDYARAWHGAAGEIIPLSENFRSREGLLHFVNSVCRLVLRDAVGGINYDPAAELKFGAPAARVELSAARDAAPRVELLLHRKPGRNESPEDAGGELADLDEAQKEARLVAARLQQLVADRYEIWDEQARALRPVAWRDMAVLLRSPSGKSEVYAKEFERAGIPLAVARGRFYESAEILDLLSLLQLLDNPLQDVPCIAVLRSPLVGLSLEELAQIRLVASGHFWTALARSQNSSGGLPEPTAAKTRVFLERFSRWRKMARQHSLSACLEAVLDETLYADWLRAQSRGAQRTANVAAFLNLAQQFDQFQRQGLFRFLKFIEAQQAAEAEPEVAAASAGNAVQLMSIHQSKGLEFPVVVLADLAKTFNEQDLHGEIIFDEELGLCPKIKPPTSGRRYPSLPHWLAQRRQQRELRGEELRLLYVALTRARDNLILTAGISEKQWDDAWTNAQAATVQKIVSARSFADWLALWFAQNVAVANSNAGATPLLRWRLLDDADLASEWNEHLHGPEQKIDGIHSPDVLPVERAAPDSSALAALNERLSWQYPFAAATGRKAKSSVTALRREADELDDEAEQVFAPAISQGKAVKKLAAPKSGLSASEVGAAHHTFLQHVDLGGLHNLTAEADRLARENYLSAAERAALDLSALENFWRSPLGRAISAQTANVRRELPFTARFSPAEIAAITGIVADAGLEKEFIVVQGVADLLVLRPDEIWLVDFKTDEVSRSGLAEKIEAYTPQLKLYSSALEKIFHRPVKLRALHFLAARQTIEV